MALSRSTSFTAGSLPFTDLEGEFNNFANYINTYLLSSPIVADIDMADAWTFTNLRKLWNVRNAAEYASLQTALNDLPAGGGMVLVPPETTISISETVTFPQPNIWLVGSGPSSILQRASGTFTETSEGFLLVNDKANCAVMNLQIDGQQLSNATGGGLTGIHIMGTSSNFHAARLYIRRWGASTDDLNTVRNEGILVGENETDVPSGIWIVNSNFTDVRRNDIAVINGRNIWIDGNDLICSSISTGNAAIDVESDGTAGTALQNVSITRNRIGDIALGSFRHLYGIVVQTLFNMGATPSTSFMNAVVSDNQIMNAGSIGIHCDRWLTASIKGNLIYRCSQTDSASNGIQIQNSQHLSIEGNEIFEQGEGIASGTGANVDGINIGGGDAASQPRCQFIGVMGNRIWRTARHSIAVGSAQAALACKDIEIEGNHCLEYAHKDTNSGSGISIDANAGAMADIGIKGNRVTLNGITPTYADPNGVNFAPLGGGTITGVILTGNNLRGSSAGTGAAINGRSNVTNLEEGHNLET